MNPVHPTNNSSEVKIPFYKKLCRKKWFKILRPIIIAALVILVIYILTIVGIFKIKKIEQDIELEYAKELSEVTNQYIGKGYFSLNLEQLEEDIESFDKYIKSVSAEKIFPNKISLKIQEYQPLYYLEYKDTCYIFSEEGLIVEENLEYEECTLEHGILLKSQENILAGNRLIFDLELSQVVKILKKFGWKMTMVEFEKNILYITDGEKEIVVEVNQEYETQLSKLFLVLEKVNIEDIEYKSLDLRYQRPVMELL